jgi:hypothetical protein
MNLIHHKIVFIGLISILFISFVSACGLHPKTTPVPQDFLEKPSKIGLVWVSFSPHPICNTASAGLLGQYVAKEANEQIITRFKSISIKSMMEQFYMDTFKKEFTSMGFQVFKGKPIIDEWDDWSLCPHGEWTRIINKDKIPDDYNQFIQENNLDYLLIVDVAFLGVSKPLTGVPFGIGVKQQIYCDIRGYLANSKDNSIIARKLFYTDKKFPEKDNPPDFPAVTRAFEQTMQEGIDQIFVFIFQKAP